MSSIRLRGFRLNMDSQRLPAPCSVSWVNSCKEITSGVKAFKVPALPKVLNGRIYGHGKRWKSPNSSDTSSKLGKLTWLWTTNINQPWMCYTSTYFVFLRFLLEKRGPSEATSVTWRKLHRDFNAFPQNDHIPHFKGTWVPTILRTSQIPG